MALVGYGKKLRKIHEDVRKKAGKTYKCPSCSRSAIRREANGVWKCRKCGDKFASGAFEFRQ